MATQINKKVIIDKIEELLKSKLKIRDSYNYTLMVNYTVQTTLHKGPKGKLVEKTVRINGKDGVRIGCNLFRKRVVEHDEQIAERVYDDLMKTMFNGVEMAYYMETLADMIMSNKSIEPYFELEEIPAFGVYHIITRPYRIMEQIYCEETQRYKGVKQLPNFEKINPKEFTDVTTFTFDPITGTVSMTEDTKLLTNEYIKDKSFSNYYKTLSVIFLKKLTKSKNEARFFTFYGAFHPFRIHRPKLIKFPLDMNKGYQELYRQLYISQFLAKSMVPSDSRDMESNGRFTVNLSDAKIYFIPTDELCKGLNIKRNVNLGILGFTKLIFGQFYTAKYPNKQLETYRLNLRRVKQIEAEDMMKVGVADSLPPFYPKDLMDANHAFREKFIGYYDLVNSFDSFIETLYVHNKMKFGTIDSPHELLDCMQDVYLVPADASYGKEVKICVPEIE